MSVDDIRNKFADCIPIETPLIVEKVSAVQQKPISWLWKDVIAYGKLTLFAGEPGVGKSQLLLYIASVISNGITFHYQANPVSQGRVLIIAGEDSADDTLKPRLLALNADLDNIDYMKGIKRTDMKGNVYYDDICLAENFFGIEKLLTQNKYSCIIVDPIAAYLGSADENNNKEIRALLTRYSVLAQRHHCAFLFNSHFSKPSGSFNKNAIYRVMGSIGFAAAARIVYGIMKDPDDPQRRFFIPIKNNIGQDKEGFVYRIKPVMLADQIETSVVDWYGEKVDKTANEILNATSNPDSPKLEEAKEFLKELLKFGSIPLTEIRQKWKIKKLSIDRLYAAKDELKIFECYSSDKKRGKIWMLPPN